MAIHSVSFKRKMSAGLVANIYIYHPQTGTDEKLVFTGDQASSSLDQGVSYTLHWALWGQAGDSLAIDRKVLGVDVNYLSLLGSSNIPSSPGTPGGAPLTFQDSLNFQI